MGKMGTVAILALLTAAVPALGACGKTDIRPISGGERSSQSADRDLRPLEKGDRGALAEGEYRAGELLVKFKAGVTRETAERIAGEQGLTITRLVSPPGLYLVRIPEAASLQEAIRRLAAQTEVEYAEPNYTRR